MIIIKNDLFGVSRRLNKIYKGYGVAYDRRRNKLYLIDKYLGNKKLMCIKDVDYSLVDYISKNNAVHKNEIYNAMELHNEKIENYNRKMLKDCANDRYKEIYNYANVNSKDFDNQSMYINDWQ